MSHSITWQKAKPGLYLIREINSENYPFRIIAWRITTFSNQQPTLRQPATIDGVYVYWPIVTIDYPNLDISLPTQEMVTNYNFEQAIKTIIENSNW